MADAGLPLRRPPVLDPAASLGWRTGPLDGLSCLLRCVESVLRAQGFDRLAVAQALAAPLDLTGGRREPSRFRHGHLDWRNATDGHEHWAQLCALVAAGTPVLLMPDRYYWPGDEFEGRRHFLDHMVLAVGCTGSALEVLDTDAPPQDGYRRWLPVTPGLVRGACRFATVHIGRPQETASSLRGTLLRPSVEWLGADLPAVRGLADRWEREGLTGRTARALHVLVLGEVQPALFLTGLATEPVFPAVAAAAGTAARSAQLLGMTLLGAHRYAGTDEDDRSVYVDALPALRRIARELERFVAAAAAELGTDPPRPLPATRDDRLWDRVRRMRDWCFGDEVAASAEAGTGGRDR